jgi:hypothetical protein
LLAVAELGDLSYQVTADSETWQTSSTSPSAALAQPLLLEMQSGGYQLAYAGYLDISGIAWGCVAACPDGSAISVVLRPEKLGEEPGPGNPLSVTVTHTFVPETH